LVRAQDGTFAPQIIWEGKMCARLRAQLESV
jgi:hypothetical protein